MGEMGYHDEGSHLDNERDRAMWDEYKRKAAGVRVGLRRRRSEVITGVWVQTAGEGRKPIPIPMDVAIPVYEGDTVEMTVTAESLFQALAAAAQWSRKVDEMGGTPPEFDDGGEDVYG